MSLNSWGSRLFCFSNVCEKLSHYYWENFSLKVFFFMRNHEVPFQPFRRCQNCERVLGAEKFHLRLGNNSFKVLQFLFQNLLIRRPRTDNNACLRPCAGFWTHFTRMMFLVHLHTILIVLIWGYEHNLVPMILLNYLKNNCGTEN